MSFLILIRKMYYELPLQNKKKNYQKKADSDQTKKFFLTNTT